MAILNMNYGGGGEEYTAGDGIDISDAVISATNTGKAKVLTTADYNYPTDNPSCVALWLLEPGIYSWGSDVAFRGNAAWSDQTNSPGVCVIWDAGDGQLGTIFFYKGSEHWYQLMNSATGQSNWTNRGLLNTAVYQRGNYNQVRIGYDTNSSGTRSTAIGSSASATATDAIVIGTSAKTSSTSATDAIVIGNSATTGASGTVVIGRKALCNSGNGIAIGSNVKSNGIAIGENIPLSPGIVIGSGVQAQASNAVAIGDFSTIPTTSSYAVAIGSSARVSEKAPCSVALGSYSKATQQGEVGIGLGPNSTYGYNNSPYRLLTGLYDPQSAHDAATKGYVDTAVAGAGANQINSQDWSDLWQ